MSAADSGPAQSSTSSAQSDPWILGCRFFDSTCTSHIILDDLRSELGFQDEPLQWLEVIGRDVRYGYVDSVADASGRREAAAQLASTSPDTRVFFLEHIFQHLAPNGFDPSEKGIMRFSIGLGEDALAWFFHQQQIHPLFLETLHFQLHNSVYQSVDHDGHLSHIHIGVKLPPVGHLEAAFYIKFDVQTKRTVAIVAGNDLLNHAKTIGENLRINGPPLDPFALPCLLLTRYLRFVEAQSIQTSHAVIMTERETGRGAIAYSGGHARPTIEPDKFDLTRMHWLEGNQRNIVGAAEAQLKLATFLAEEHTQYVRHRTGTPFDRLQLTPVERAVYEKLKSHRTLVDGIAATARAMQERIQRQLSAADSIINQSDNKVSLTNAAANTRIAEQSKRIAEETRRDSTSMKTIASLTMVYLPSTFAATVFGTGFFSYQRGDEVVFQVHSEIWQLVVTSLVLSALTIGVWIGINKYGIPAQLSWARQTEARGVNDQEVALQNLTASSTIRPPISIVSRPNINLPVR